MAVSKELDDRMTVNIQSSKKKKLQRIAVEEKLSDSRLLLKIVDEWLETRMNGQVRGGES